MRKSTERYTFLLPALEAKCEELRVLESGTLNADELWAYCRKRLWRKKNIDELNIHRLVADIMSVKLSDYVAYSQVEGFKEDNWFSGAAKDEWQQLLRPPSGKKPV